jgi:hypothetical protein
MRRLPAIAAFLAFTLPLSAQVRGGGHGMGAPRGGFAGASFSHRGPALGFHGGHGFPHHSFPGPFVPGQFFPGRFHHHHGFWFSGSFGSPWWGSSAFWGYSGLYPGYGYPVLSYSERAADYYPPLDISYPLNASYFASAEDQRRIENRLHRLEERMNRFLDEQYAKSAATQAAKTEAKAEPSPATVLVFRDQHSEEVKNYAVVGGTLWVFDEQKARKVPLTDLDIPTTMKQNEERGVTFRTAK